MNLKTKIKNDFWQVNYIIPFTLKYLRGGKRFYIKKALPIIRDLRVIKGKGKRDISTDILAMMEQVELTVQEGSRFFYCLDPHKTIAVRGMILSNFPFPYDKVIHDTFDAAADRAISAGGDYGWRAENIKRAVHTLRDRSLAAVLNSSGEYEAGMKEDFTQMLEQPARHFREGLQRILFFNQFLWQTRHTLNGLGRLDMILGDLYDADVREGKLSRAEAFDMVCDFLRSLHKWYEHKSAALIGDVGQIIILGGTDKAGEYVSNDLTELFLRAQAEVKQPDPKTLLRVSANIPDKLLKLAVECLKAQTGSPLFANDDVIIPYLERFGFPAGEAAAYCVSACWEPFIIGKSLDQNNVSVFDFFMPLDQCLRETAAGQVDSYDALVAMYEGSLRKAWQDFLKELDELTWAKDPLLSMFIDGCSEQGKDISEGGAVYCNYGVTTVGLGSVCDSLLNIKKFVFEDKKTSLNELDRHREADYQTAPQLYEQLGAMPKHFAHDDSEAVELVNRLLDVSNEEVAKYTNPLGGRVKFGLSSPDYIKAAKRAPADFAGRKKGSAYGTHISASDASYTELALFSGMLRLGRQGFNGNVVDFFLSPNFLTDHVEQFVLYMKGAIQAGFFEMQMNVMDSKTLIDAKAHPERYPGLIVRVWGFSAYFNDLPEGYKDVLIKRALDAEKTAG